MKWEPKGENKPATGRAKEKKSILSRQQGAKKLPGSKNQNKVSKPSKESLGIT